MNDVYVLDGVRTPIGRYGGALASVRPDDLGARVIKALAERTQSLEPSTIDDVYFGAANTAGEDNRNVARMSLLLAGLPPSVPGATVNRLCGSGLEAIAEASRAIAVGDAQLCIARGKRIDESRTVGNAQTRAIISSRRCDCVFNNPWLANGQPENAQGLDGIARRRAELLADRHHITREVQDAFALRSHRNAEAAWNAGAYDSEVVLVEGTDLQRDESIRPNTSLESLSSLRPVFRSDGTVTAGNASPLNDGAAATLLGSSAAAQRLGVTPLARIVSRATSGVEPQLFGIGPVEAAKSALTRAGISWSDLVAVELNEAFASQSLACLEQWPELDRSIVNPNGGAIALGHPLGSSDARIVVSLAWQLKRLGGGFGLATMCIGVGQGIAMVLQA